MYLCASFIPLSVFPKQVVDVTPTPPTGAELSFQSPTATVEEQKQDPRSSRDPLQHTGLKRGQVQNEEQI